MTDLPFGRGGTPLQNLIELGYSETKLSAIRCVKEFDAGPIFLKRKLSLRGSASQIFARAERLMPKMIEEIVTRDIVPVSQAGDVVQFRRRTPDMSKLSSAYSPETIYDQIRMVDADGYPRAFIEWGQYRIEFSRVALSNGTVSGAFVMKKGNEN
jgi:methionyl-tRNA formyltransferase